MKYDGLDNFPSILFSLPSQSSCPEDELCFDAALMANVYTQNVNISLKKTMFYKRNFLGRDWSNANAKMSPDQSLDPDLIGNREI